MRESCPNYMRLILLIALAFSTWGCTAQKQKPFDNQEAAKIISSSEQFKDCHRGINNRDVCNYNLYTGRWEMVASYWGSAKDHPHPESLRTNPIGYWFYRKKGYLQLSSSPEVLSLSDTGRSASKDWSLIGLPGKEVPGALERWEVPLATKKFVTITRVVREQRMGIQIARVTYRWVYSLTSLGIELFNNARISSTGRGNEWSAPADLTGIDLKKTYQDDAIFTFVNGSWHLEDHCTPLDVCG